MKRKQRTRVGGKFLTLGIALGCLGLGFIIGSIIWNSVQDGSDAIVDPFVTPELVDSHYEGPIKPGGTLDMSPAITNQSTMDCNAFIKVIMPVVDDEPAYTFEAGSGWTQLDISDDPGVLIWAYGSDTYLTPVVSGSTTSALTETGFTMKADITGPELSTMGDVNVYIVGYLANTEAGTNPEDVWATNPEG